MHHTHASAYQWRIHERGEGAMPPPHRRLAKRYQTIVGLQTAPKSTADPCTRELTALPRPSWWRGADCPSPRTLPPPFRALSFRRIGRPSHSLSIRPWRTLVPVDVNCIRNMLVDQLISWMITFERRREKVEAPCHRNQSVDKSNDPVPWTFYTNTSV